MKTKVVFVLVDALRWDYIDKNNTPFLWHLSKQSVYVKKLTPSFGYCERTEIFTGCPPDKSDNFTAIGYAPERSPFHFLQKQAFLKFAFWDADIFYNRCSRRVLASICKLFGITFPLYQIPFRCLPELGLTEDFVKHTEANAFNVESVFDVARKSDLKIFYDSFTALGMHNGNDENRTTRLLDNKAHGFDLNLLFIGAADAMGHLYGTQSSQLKDAVRNIDAKLERVYDVFIKPDNNSCLLVAGDHGMLDVKRYFDVLKRTQQFCKENGLAPQKDFFMFLDSTLARFWPRNSYVYDKIYSMLMSPEFREAGVVITPELAQMYHVPIPSRLYGKLAWWAHPKVVISPDYYNRKKIKAMHGYAPELDESKGLCIITSNQIRSKLIEEGRLIDICPTLCTCLGIDLPTENQGNSFIA